MSIQRSGSDTRCGRLHSLRWAWRGVALLATTLAVQVASAACFSPPTGLIGWWPGDGNANNFLGTNNGTLQGGALASAGGMVGNAFSFDGTNSYVQIPNSTVLQPTNLTVECWVRFVGLDSPGTAAVGVQYIVFKQNTRTANFEGFDLGKSRAGGNDVFRFIISAAGGQSISLQSTTTISAGVWYHVAAVRGGNFAQLYVNGVLERQTNVTFAQNYGNFPLYFGTSGQSYWDRKLKGDLDEVTLYQRALSAGEIAAIYSAGAAGKCKSNGPQASLLVNVDFEGGTQSSMTGPAAIGQGTNDFWNAYEGAGAWHYDGTLALLKAANGSNTQIGLSVPNTPGSWGNGSSNPMYQGYIYPNPPEEIVITVTNLPAARYDFYLYSSDGNFQLTAAGANYGVKTSLDNPVNNPPVWQEGRQYVVFRDVLVTEFAPPVVVTVRPGVFGYSTVSGMQIAANLQPWFTLQPTNTNLVEGDNLVLRANAFGFTSLEHRWYFNGAPLVANARISGAASNTLSILNVTTNDTGNYWCVASNAAGAVTSAVAVVTIQQLVCASPSGLVAWWTGDGQALDSANTNHGVLSNGVVFASGRVGSAFGFDGANDLVRFAASGSLNVGVSDGLTLECWVKPSEVGSSHALIEWGDTSKPRPFGVHLWISINGGPGCLFANLVDTSGNDHGFWTGAGVVNTSTFVHVALTYDKTTGVGIFYSNGIPITVQNLGVFTPQTSYPLYLGHRPADGGNYFAGLLDEVGIYARALSAAELKAIYDAGVLGKCHQAIALIQQPQGQAKFEQQTATFAASATGALPLTYQWYFNGVLLADAGRVSGATNYALTISGLQTNDAGSYWVVASNASGMVTSVLAALTVDPVVCAPAAQGIVAWWKWEGNTVDGAGVNHGTMFNGAGFATGHVGSALSLDGINDHLRVADQPGLRFTNEITVEAWVYPTAVTGFHCILSKWDAVVGPEQRSYALGLNPDGRASLVVSPDGTVNGVTSASTIEALPINAWSHLSVTYDGAALRIYINGALNNQTPYVQGIFAGTADLGVGANVGGSVAGDVNSPFAALFKGLIDEAAVYNRALSAGEIAGIFNAGSLGKCPLPLAIAQQPQSQARTEGLSVTFAAPAVGTPPIGYQWYFNGTPVLNGGRVTGATAANLMITNLQTSDAGNYWLVASDISGVVTSQVATLTVTPPVCSPPVGGLVSWWTAEGQAFDSANTNHGTLIGNATYGTGRVGGGFVLDGAGDGVVVGNPASLQLQNFTIETWIKRDHPTIVTSGSPSSALFFGYGYGGYGLGIYNDGRLFLTRVGIDNVTMSTPVISDTNYHHVVVTKMGSTVFFYIDGVAYPVPTYNTTYTFGTAAAIGIRADVPEAGFLGVIDEVAVYNRPLTGVEVESIYIAGALGKCPLPMTFAQQPLSQNKVEEQSVLFAASAVGALPLAYQWYFNGTPLLDGGRFLGVTNLALSIGNLSTNDTGSYWVVVSNFTGQATSTVATLTVSPISCSPVAAGLVDWWSGDNHAFDYAGTNHQTLVNGAAFAAGKVGTAFSFDGVDDCATNANPKLTSVANSTYTIEFWARPTAARASTSESTSGLAGISNQRYAVFPDAGDTTMAGAGVSVGTNGVSVFEHGNTYLPSLLVYNTSLTNWTHIAVVYQARQPRLYLNGVLVRAGLTSSRTSYPSTSLGERGQGYGYYAGLLDEISIYNRALSDAEVADIYSSQSLGKCPLPPRFVQPLANASFPRGSQIVLPAAATGALPLAHQWYYNDAPLANGGRVQGATSNTLEISAAEFADAGNYYVVVTNPYGAATSTVALVQVINAPFLAQQPTNQFGVVGGAVQFTALAGGDAPFTYGWYLNATALVEDARHSGTATASLTISNLVVGDAGNYTLRVTNVFGSVTSAVANLTVFTPPAITTQPRGYSVPIGLPVTLAGAASGTAPLRYQWQLDGAPVANATNASLTISNLAAANFGSYQLVVTNGGGSVTSAVASLTVGPVGTWGYFTAVASAPIWPAAGLSNVAAVAAGSSYSLALRQDGTVYAWGFNSSATNLPAGLSGVVRIAAGQSHALAVLSNGMVRAWGLGTSGQTNVPATLSNVIAVAAGSAHSAALRSDGTVVVWGGSSTEAQTNVPPGLMKVVAIDAGGSQTLALREDGRLFGWGGRIQYPVPYDVKEVAGFSVGPAFSALNLAVNSNGLVRAWGGTGSATNVPASVNGIVAVEGAGGNDQSTGVSLALRSNRTVTGWGGFVGASSLTNIPVGLSNVLALAGGLSHALALVDDGRPVIIRPPIGGTFYSGRDLVIKAKAIGNAPLSFQWFKDGNPIPGGTDETLVLPFAVTGDAGNYQLAVTNPLGFAQSVIVPVVIVDRAPVLMSQPRGRYAYYGSPFSVGASVIGSGPMDFTWLQDGVAVYVGTNDLVFERAFPPHGGSYQLIAGNPFGSVTSSVAPIRFSRVASWGGMPAFTNIPAEVDLGTVRGVAAGGFHALVIRSNGTVAAWGSQLYGTTNVPAGLNDVTAVAAGSDFSVALKQDGTVVAWGLNSSGQTNVPADLTEITAISVGASHSLALRTDGTVVAWGLNSSGQTNVPAGLSNVVAIAAGSVHSLALKSDGTIVGWGTFGKIPTYSEVVAIAAGLGQSLALQADGTIRAWSTGGAVTGLPPAGLSNVVAISAGVGAYGNTYQGVALKRDGSVAIWSTGRGIL